MSGFDEEGRATSVIDALEQVARERWFGHPREVAEAVYDAVVQAGMVPQDYCHGLAAELGEAEVRIEELENGIRDYIFGRSVRLSRLLEREEEGA